MKPVTNTHLISTAHERGKHGRAEGVLAIPAVALAGSLGFSLQLAVNCPVRHGL